MIACPTTFTDAWYLDCRRFWRPPYSLDISDALGLRPQLPHLRSRSQGHRPRIHQNCSSKVNQFWFHNRDPYIVSVPDDLRATDYAHLPHFDSFQKQLSHSNSTCFGSTLITKSSKQTRRITGLLFTVLFQAIRRVPPQ